MKRISLTVALITLAVVIDLQRLAISLGNSLLTLMVKGSDLVLSFTSKLEPKLKGASDGAKSRAKAAWSSKG